MTPVILLTGNNWIRPATNTVMVCIVVFGLCVGVGHYLCRKQRRSLGTILFMLSIPWGFALALYSIDKVGLAEPYSQESRIAAPAAMEPTFQPESPRNETPFATEHYSE